MTNNTFEKTISASLKVDRRYKSDEAYTKGGYSSADVDVTWVQLGNGGATLDMAKTKDLIAALQAIVESVEGLVPKEDFRDKLVGAPQGSTLLNKSNGNTFVKLGTGVWVGLKNGYKFNSRDGFSNNPSNYTLTLAEVEEPLTWQERLKAAPVESVVKYKVTGDRYVKQSSGRWMGPWRNDHPSESFSETAYTLTIAGE